MNRNRKNEDWIIGELAFVKNRNRSKLDVIWNGPFKNENVSKNGNSIFLNTGRKSLWENIKNVKLFNERGQNDGYIAYSKEENSFGNSKLGEE